MPFKTRLKQVTEISVLVKVINADIENGRCGLISRCMEKVAIERALRARDPKGGDHKVRIDGGAFRFTFQGYRWSGMTPRAIKKTLIMYDKERKPRERAEKLGEKFTSKIKPHDWRAVAVRGAKIEPFTRERMDQVNAARNRRKAEGRPDKTKYDLRYRVEGLGAA